MSQNPDDFFGLVGYDDEEIPEWIPRDRWKRPLIIPPEGGEPIAYSRMSSLANHIENRSGLHIWDVRQVVVGMGIREDLAAMAAALPSLTRDKRKDAATNARLSEIAEEARTSAGAHAEAGWGTAVHGFTEMGMEGNTAVPERMKADVRSYWDGLKEYRLIVVATEIFVVNDELKCAGTFDDLMWHPAFGLVVGDKKTGRKNMHSTLIQLAGYAGGCLYNPETGERAPLTSLAPEDLGATEMNRDVALYIHIPKEEGRTEFLKLDIALGAEAARHAAWVRDYTRRKDFVTSAHEEMLEGVEALQQNARELMDSCTTVEEMRAIWKQHEHVWTDELSSYGMNCLRRAAVAS